MKDFVCGSLLASLMICLAYRRFKHWPLWGHSCCEHCHTRLTPISLIPIVGYLLHKGRCQDCGEKINIFYPLAEALGGCLQLLTVHYYGYDHHLLLMWLLFYLAIYDFFSYEIADDALALLLLGGLFNNYYTITKTVGALMLLFILMVISIFMEMILKEAMIGGGDFKLLFVTGMYLGFYGNIACLFLASLLGLGLIVFKRQRMIPFGPPIALAFYFMLRLLW